MLKPNLENMSAALCNCGTYKVDDLHGLLRFSIEIDCWFTAIHCMKSTLLQINKQESACNRLPNN